MRRNMMIRLAAVAFGLAAAVGVAEAQRAPYEGGGARITGGMPGRFDYYSLVLSWSPTHCATVQRPDDTQCNRRDGRRFSFVLHGLWPQHERGYPEFCPTAERPFVPESTIDRMMDIMPARGLTIHQYRKHGVCSGLAPEPFFSLSRRLYERVRIPARFKDPAQNQMVDTRAVIGEFVAANPGLRPDMLAVSCGGPGDRLREVRICFTREGEFRTCGSNEDQRRLCRADRVFVPPVRPARGEDSLGRGRGAPMLPGPVPPPASGSRAL